MCFYNVGIKGDILTNYGDTFISQLIKLGKAYGIDLIKKINILLFAIVLTHYMYIRSILIRNGQKLKIKMGAILHKYHYKRQN